MHILENVPTFWDNFLVPLLIIIAVVAILVTFAIIVAKRSKDGVESAGFVALVASAVAITAMGLSVAGPVFAPRSLEIAGEHLQKEAKEQYGISLTKVEAQKLIDPQHYKTASTKCDYDPYNETRPYTCNDVFEDRDNPDSNYHRFGHVQIATIKGEKVSLTSIELVRLNDEYRLAYYGKNNEKNTIRELPHL